MRSTRTLEQTDPLVPPSEQQHSTATLVALLRSGDPDAGTSLDTQYRAPLTRFCWGYLGQHDQVEDAVQEVCVKVLSAKTIPDQFRPWIYKIARHYCLNVLRDRVARHADDALHASSQIHAVMTGHLTRLAREERHQRLAELVRSLSVEQSEVLRLRYVENLSRAEIADVLELSERLVKSRIFEGLKTLREFATQLEDT